MTENCREFFADFPVGDIGLVYGDSRNKPIADSGCLFSIRNRKMCG